MPRNDVCVNCSERLGNRLIYRNGAIAAKDGSICGTGRLVECSTSTTTKRRDVIARVFRQNGRGCHEF
jgi:hypothetical protein